jgi:hypothetical protein
MVHAINGDHYTIHLRARVDQHAHTRSFLKKAEEYPDSAQANLTAKRYTVAAGDAIHARICAKDAIDTELAGTTMKDHALAPKELWQAPGPRPDAASAEKGMRDLVLSDAAVEYGVTPISAVKLRRSSVEPGASSSSPCVSSA